MTDELDDELDILAEEPSTSGREKFKQVIRELRKGIDRIYKAQDLLEEMGESDASANLGYVLEDAEETLRNLSVL